MSGDSAADRVRDLVEADPIVLVEIATAVGESGRFPPDAVIEVATQHSVRLPDSDKTRLRAAIEQALMSHDVDAALEWLHLAGVLRALFPELEATVDLVQETG